MKVVTIGRDNGNDVVIDGTKISRHHAQIIKDGNSYWIVDFNSTNGTFVNGKKISGEVSLMPSDSVRLGDRSLPWMNYFWNGGSVRQIFGRAVKNRKVLYIGLSAAAGIAVLLAIVIGINRFGIEAERKQWEAALVCEQYGKQIVSETFYGGTNIKTKYISGYPFVEQLIFDLTFNSDTTKTSYFYSCTIVMQSDGSYDVTKPNDTLDEWMTFYNVADKGRPFVPCFNIKK